MELRKKIKKFVLLTIFVLSFLQSSPTISAYAFGGFGINTEFDSLEGDNRYLGSEYRNNYKLDVEDLGITEVTEKMLNSLSNIIFSIISFIGLLAVSIFFHSINFDLASLLQNQISQIQETLHTGLFLPLLQLAIVGAIILAICKYTRRDFVGLLEQLGRVCFIMILSILMVSDSANFLSYASSVTKGASVSILTGINDVDVGSNINHYAANAAGVLWISLVHEPWKALEFGDYNYTDDDVEFFLTESGSERQDRVTEMMDNDKGPFSKDRLALKIGQGLIILLTVCTKGSVYVLAGLMYIVFQAVAILFIIMAPIILLLSLIPGYNFEILGIWARKIMETQVGVIILTFVIGIMVFFDRALQALAPEIGWFTVLFLQIAVCYGLFRYRTQIFSTFNSAQIGIQNPKLLRKRLSRSGNPYSAMERQYRQIKKKIPKKDPKPKIQPEKPGNSKSNQKNKDSTPKSKRPNAVEKSTTKPVSNPSRVKKVEGLQNEGIHKPEDGSYYAPREVTDNWRELWDNASSGKRPSTSDNTKVVNKRPILSQATSNDSKQSPKPRRSNPERNPEVLIAKSEKGIRNAKSEAISNKENQSSSGSNEKIKTPPEVKRPITNRQRKDNEYSASPIEIRPNVSKKAPVVTKASFRHDPVQVKRPITNRQRKDIKYSASPIRIRPNVSKKVPVVAKASFRHDPTQISRGKINPASLHRVKEVLKVGNTISGSNRGGTRLTMEHSNSLKRPVTIKKSDKAKGPLPAGKSKTVSAKTSQKSLYNQSFSYNTAQSHLADVAAREISVTQAKARRPETTIRGEEKTKKEKNEGLPKSQIQIDNSEKKIQLVTKSYPGKVIRQERLKPKQRPRMSTKIPPKVQNVAINGLKASKGSSLRVVRKTTQKSLEKMR